MQMNIIRITEMLLPAATPPAFWKPLMGCAQKTILPSGVVLSQVAAPTPT